MPHVRVADAAATARATRWKICWAACWAGGLQHPDAAHANPLCRAALPANGVDNPAAGKAAGLETFWIN